MKRSLKILIVIALVLSFFDGFATYFELGAGVEELSPWPKLTQKIFGLNLWLLFHIVLYSLFGFMLFLIRAKTRFKTAGIYIWFSVEVLLAIYHIFTIYTLRLLIF